MKKVFGIHPYIVTTSLILSSSALSSELEADLFSLSIEELLQVETDVAGFASESIGNSPSVVTVFSANEIQAYGVDNLFDLMNFVPGFQAVVGEKVNAQTKLQSRGVYLDNGYVLVMIDGVKLNEVSFGKASVYTPYIDLANAEKVEIIRGPGSAIYGSNAFLGVINIVTKKDDHLAMGVGNDQYSRFSFGLTEKVGNGVMAARFSHVKGDGSDVTLMDYETNQLSKTNKPFVHQELSISWENDQIELGYRFDRHELDGFVNLVGFHPANYYRSENQYVYTKFNYPLSAKTKFKAQFDYADHLIESSGFIADSDIPPFSHDILQGPYWGTTRLAAQMSISHELNHKVKLNLGAEFQQNEQDLAGIVTSHVRQDLQSATPAIDSNYVGLERFDKFGDFNGLLQEISSKAMFGEINWQIDDKQKLNVGGRYEDYNTAGDAFSPRISYINQITKNNNVKVIYSSAFRAPVTNELYSNDGITIGNPELDPELVNTIELQWLHNKANYSLESTLFNTQMTDLIVTKAIAGSEQFTFSNEVDREVTGVEFLGNVEIITDLTARSTFTYFISDTINASYPYFATGSVFWTKGKWRTNLHAIYRPESEGVNSFDPLATKLFESKEQLIVNLSLQYQMGKNLSFRLSGTNLGDQQFMNFEPRQSQNRYAVPQPGRQLSLTAKYAF